MATINGTGRDEVLLNFAEVFFGVVSADLYNARNGDDSIYAFGGADTINAGRGDDLAFAGDGNDVVNGEQGNDSIDGGTGADTINAGDDDDIFRPGNDQDADIVDGGDGNDTVDYSLATERIFLSLRNPDFTDGASTGDRILNTEAVIATIYNDKIGGSAEDNLLDLRDGNDTAYAFEGSDTVDGGAGNDRLYGMDGTDTLLGGLDDDELFGGAGADVINGGAGRDATRYDDENHGDLLVNLADASQNTGAAAGDVFIDIEDIRGGIGNDTLIGDANANFLYGHVNHDSLEGAGGDDTLEGYVGNDTLDGAEGTNVLTGGVGWDVFVFADTGVQADTITDFVAGTDVVDVSDWGFADASAFVSAVNVVDLGAGGTQVVFSANQSLTIADAGYTFDVVDFGFEPLPPSGPLLSELISRDGGVRNMAVDLEQAGLIQDVTGQIKLWIGSDVFYGDAADNSVFAHSGHDEVHGGGGNDLLDGYAQSDTLYGDAGEDTLLGGAGHDVLDGGADNDRIDGGKGHNQLTGGAGADTFVYANWVNNCDTITDFNAAEGDKIDVSGFGFGNAATFLGAIEQMDTASGLVLRFQLGQKLTIEDTGYTLDTADFLF